MKKAHSILEVALLLCFVVVISIAVMTVFNNQKSKLVGLSGSKLTNQSVNLKDGSLSADKLNDKVKYDKVETAGTSALTQLGVSAETFNNALSNVTYAQLQAASSGNKNDNVFDLANLLISKLNLSYNEVDAANVNVETLTTFVGVLNAAADAISSPTTDEETKTIATNYVNQVKSLLNQNM